MTTMTTPNRFWDEIAEDYATRPIGDVAAFDRKKAITRQHLSPESNVLEIGCGTGSLALELSRDAAYIHAMDISAEMIRIAEDMRADRGIENVTFHVGALGLESGFAAGHFDAAWAYSILHLVDDRRQTLATLFELLAPGGVLISSNVCLGGGWIPWGPIITLARWMGKAPRVYCYDRETIAREMREVGFVDVVEKDVGAKKLVAFMLARKPE